MERYNWTKILYAIAVVGAINWGLIGFFNFNLVDAIFGGGSVEETSTISRVVYAIVGLSGLFSLPIFRARFVVPEVGKRAEVRP